MLEVRLDGGRFCPTLTCDHCGQPVTEPCVVAYAHDDPSTLRFLHKRCDPRDLPMWMDSDGFFAALVGNANVDLERGTRTLDLLDTIA